MCQAMSYGEKKTNIDSSSKPITRQWWIANKNSFNDTICHTITLPLLYDRTFKKQLIMPITKKHMNNKEILKHNLRIIDGNRELWEDLPEQAAVKSLRWIPSANEHFERIDIEDDMWYVFTWPYPSQLINDIINEDFQRIFGEEMEVRYEK